jgi:hypothetical protein
MEFVPVSLSEPYCALLAEGDDIQVRLTREFEEWQEQNPIARQLAEVCREEDAGQPRNAVEHLAP